MKNISFLNRLLEESGSNLFILCQLQRSFKAALIIRDMVGTVCIRKQSNRIQINELGFIGLHSS